MKVDESKTAPFGPLGAWTPWGSRLPFLASVAGVGGLGLWVDQAREPRGWLALVAAMGIALVMGRPSAGAGRAMGWGAAVVVASLGPHGAHRGVEAWGAIGAMACAASASVAIADMASEGGMMRPTPSSPVLAVVAVAALWWAALVALFAPLDGPLGPIAERPGALSWGAAAGSVLVLLCQAEWTLRRRVLELGVGERALALRATLTMALVTLTVVGALGPDQGNAVGRLVVAASSALAGWAALYPDAVRVARISRRIIVLTVTGGGVALLGASTADGSRALGMTLATAAVVMVIGAIAPWLEAPLRPARGVWLEAFARARVACSRAEPEDAIREALVALRAPGRLSSASPELWMSEPPRVTTVDRAGYVHERDAELVGGLILAAVGEPEGTLRVDVLDSLEVRRPELRPISKWMADRQGMLATIVVCEGEAEGMLVLPRVGREEPATLEEVRALKDVADRLGAACRAVGVRTRMLARAYEASERAQSAEEELERGRHQRVLDVARDTLTTTRLARPATLGVYSAASRMALEALERQTTLGGVITVVAPSGVDPVPYLARAHLAGVRADAPLVFVDGASAREHDSMRWRSPVVSPLALAHRGMLVLVDGAALPAEVQQLVARAIAERRAPWDCPGPLDVQLAFTAVVAPEQLVEQERLDPSLALRLAAASSPPILLPRLRDRVDDLRTIITDGLAREGLRVLGRPVGIEPAAYARLIEHSFPGEDGELTVIVQRLVARSAGEVVRVADVDALRLTVRPTGPARQGSRTQRKSPYA